MTFRIRFYSRRGWTAHWIDSENVTHIMRISKGEQP